MSAHRECCINLKHFDEIVLSGDLHGDLLALIKVLKLSRCVEIDPGEEKMAQACPVAQDSQQRHREIDRSRLRHYRWKNKCRKAIVFLGDILDNRRFAHDDAFGVCARTDTQTFMLMVLAHLKQQAERQGGKLLILLGNHDVANMQVGDQFCARFAPKYSAYHNQAGMHLTCDANGGYTRQHCDAMKQLFAPWHYLTVGLLHYDDRPVGLLCHGGIDPNIFATADPQYRVVENDYIANVVRMNLLTQHMLANDDAAARQFADRHVSRMPYWCRFDGTQGYRYNQLEKYFGCSFTAVGHTITENIRCVTVGGSDDGELQGHTQCRIDLGMARCFPRSSPRIYGVLVLSTNEHGTSFYKQKRVCS